MVSIRSRRGIPQEVAWSSFDSPDLRSRVHPASAVDEAIRASAQPLIVIAGPAGTGKSSLAAALVRARKASPAVFVHVRHAVAEPSEIDACVAAKTLVLEFDDEPRKAPAPAHGQSPESAALDLQLEEGAWEEMVDEAIDEGRIIRLDVAALVWPRVTGSKFTILTTCRDARSFLDDHPVLEQARHELTVIELEQGYRWSRAIPTAGW